MFPSFRVTALFAILGLVWGSAFVAVELIVHQLPPWFSAACRLGIASLALFFMVRVRRRRLTIPRREILKVWGAGILAIGLPFSCLFWSEQKVSGGLGGIINGTVPIWTSLFLMMRQIKNSQKILDVQILGGVLLGFFGLWIIFYPRISISSGGMNEEFSGALGLLAMALSYSISNILNRRILTSPKAPPVETMIFHQHFVSFLCILTLSWATESWPTFQEVVKPSNAATLIYLGVVPSSLAYLIYFYLLKKIGAVQTAAVTYVIPIVALLLDFAIVGNIPALSSLVGVCFILIALAFIRSSKPT